MANCESPSRFVIVSPVKDEGRYIRDTITSLIRQTVKPICWVIVDDDSQDNTSEIVSSFSREFTWIELITTRRGSGRKLGSAEALAFYIGYNLVRNLDFDFLIKLDGDLILEDEYFEKMLTKFNEDPQLGIASGIYLEDHGKGWQPVNLPYYHAAGAARMVRRRCFEDIGGFLTTPGWDTVDEIRAQHRGWKTCHFKDVRFLHLKNEGSGMGYCQTNIMHGEIFYLTGGSRLFFCLKAAHRLVFGKPILIGGLMMIFGFLKAAAGGKALLVTPPEAEFYRWLQKRRILNTVRNLLLLSSHRSDTAESA
ncbi:MAG TPA: glycosyltransferase family A protein [Acidobacteriota bacterium]|jgi:glycosyltransferase involved in cell wall biosynthesis